MSSDATFKAEIPEPVRDLMQSNVEQTRHAFDTMVSNVETSTVSFQSSSRTAAKNMLSFSQKLLAMTRENVDANFKLAMELAEAKDMSEAVQLQNDHVQKRMESFAKQMEEIRDLTGQWVQVSVSQLEREAGETQKPAKPATNGEQPIAAKDDNGASQSIGRF